MEVYNGKGDDTPAAQFTVSQELEQHQLCYQAAVQSLSEATYQYLVDEGLTEPWHIHNAAAATVDTYLCEATNTEKRIMVPAATNFALAIARKNKECAQGTSEWTKVVELYRSAVAFTNVERPETGPPDDLPPEEDADLSARYPGTETEEELRKGEYMTIKGDYRRAALARLNDTWRYKVPKASLPSYRLWGMVCRCKWLYGEYQPIEFWQLQNAEQGRLKEPQTGVRAQLREDTQGSGWHLPALNVPTPGNQGHLEEALKVLHNTIILCGWVQDPTVVIAWHHKFWARACSLTAPKFGQGVPHTIKDIMVGHVKFQRQWALWSEEHPYLDECIRKSLPEEEDIVDARMSLQPKYTTAPKGGKGANHDATGTERPTRRGKNQAAKGSWKGGAATGKGKTSLINSLVDQLANATGTTRNQILGKQGGKPPKGKNKGKDRKGKGKGKDRKGKGKTNSTPCITWLNTGSCPRGDRCRFAHN